MKRYTIIILSALVLISNPAMAQFDTWANWTRLLKESSDKVPNRKLPGRTVGLLVPAENRDDAYSLSAFSYQTLTKNAFKTAIIFMQAPPQSNFNGLTLPAIDIIETSFGRFLVDTELRDLMADPNYGINIQPSLFDRTVPEELERQLAFIKYTSRRGSADIKVLPIYVRFSDPNSQVRDYAPYVIDRIKEYGIGDDLIFIVVSDLATASSPEKIIDADNRLLRGVRNIDIDSILEWQVGSPEGIYIQQFDALLMGLLTLRWSGADHGEILGYGNTGQLILTKNKRIPTGMTGAAFASAAPILPKLKHVPQERMLDTFTESFRTDIMTMVRQACLSALDPTAAKPPSLQYKEASKPWPVYISIYDEKGNLLAQSGTHKAVGPLEESLRRYAVECVRRSRPKLTTDIFKSCVLEISIPYGFRGNENPDYIIPFLNGAVLTQQRKSAACHTDAWRKFPDAHQLWAALAIEIDMPPWSYAFTNADRESFRLFSFNEKEPFPEMIQMEKKKKKDSTDDDLGDLPDTGGGFGF